MQSRCTFAGEASLQHGGWDNHPPCFDDQSSGTSSSATMLMILISGLIAGPAVSL